MYWDRDNGGENQFLDKYSYSVYDEFNKNRKSILKAICGWQDAYHAIIEISSNFLHKISSNFSNFFIFSSSKAESLSKRVFFFSSFSCLFIFFSESLSSNLAACVKR